MKVVGDVPYTGRRALLQPTAVCYVRKGRWGREARGSTSYKV